MAQNRSPGLYSRGRSSIDDTLRRRASALSSRLRCWRPPSASFPRNRDAYSIGAEAMRPTPEPLAQFIELRQYNPLSWPSGSFVDLFDRPSRTPRDATGRPSSVVFEISIARTVFLDAVASIPLPPEPGNCGLLTTRAIYGTPTERANASIG